MDPLKVSSDSPSSLLSLKASEFLFNLSADNTANGIFVTIYCISSPPPIFLPFFSVCGFVWGFFGLVWFGFFK